MVCLEMELYYENKSENICTKFIEFIKYLDSLEPWIFLCLNEIRKA